MSRARGQPGFWVPYILSIVAVVVTMVFQEVLPGPPWFVWGLVGVLAVWAVVLIIYGTRPSFTNGQTPACYSPQHFLLLLWLTVPAFLIGIVLHNALYALFWYAIPVFTGGDEAVFFFIALIIVPAGYVAGAVGRLWDWIVSGPAEAMTGTAPGVSLPTRWYYFAPIGSYLWLWRFGRGIEALTGRRVRAGGVFAAVFFLGILGFAVVREAARRRGLS